MRKLSMCILNSFALTAVTVIVGVWSIGCERKLPCGYCQDTGYMRCLSEDHNGNYISTPYGLKTMEQLRVCPLCHGTKKVPCPHCRTGAGVSAQRLSSSSPSFKGRGYACLVPGCRCLAFENQPGYASWCRNCGHHLNDH